jgi:hypothetical protein
MTTRQNREDAEFELMDAEYVWKEEGDTEAADRHIYAAWRCLFPLNAAVQRRIAEGRRQWGDKFDPSALLEAPAMHRWYESQERVTIDIWGNGVAIERGRVSTTAGWKPAFLLMLRKNSTGSPWLLDSRSKVVGPQAFEGPGNVPPLVTR